MNVVLVVDGSIDQVSGGYLYDRRLADHLRSQGDPVEVISLPTGPYVRRFGTNSSRTLLHRLTMRDVDVVLEDELSHPGLIVLNGRLRRNGGPPIVAIVHHLRASEPTSAGMRALFRFFEAWYLRTVDGLICNSAATRHAVDLLVRRPIPVVVAPPAGDRFRSTLTETAVQTRAREPGSLRVLFVGNLIRRKGLLPLLDAMAELPPSVAQLEVVGDATFDAGYAAIVRRRIEQRRLSDRVRLTGPLYDERLAERLAASHLLVVPSEYEGFGIVYLEAMAFGVPAIGSVAGGASEVIRDGENGYLVPPGDVAALVGRIRNLALNRIHLETMSLAALRTFRAHPTWRESAERVRRFLADEIARPARHPFPAPMEEPI